MAMKWTAQQSQVITSRNSNLLVSAAAGSGKTAVLVERIIQMITDPNGPIDIDRLLVMTFTNAAAAEMRQRISDAIEKRLKQQPGNIHLQRQSTLVQYAQITTIDSFCLYLIRNYFEQLEIDPSFRIGDEGELRLLQADTMERMLEDFYEKEDPLFEQFVDSYAFGKSDQGIDQYIYQTYTFSQSNPWPEDWIDQKSEEAWKNGGQEWGQTLWMEFLMKDARTQLIQMVRQLEAAAEICSQQGGPYMYLPMLEADLEELRRISRITEYPELNQALKQFSFVRLAAARDKQLDPEKKEQVSACRDRVKKAVAKLKSGYCMEDSETAQKDMEQSGIMMNVLLELTREYARRYQRAKSDKNIVDFNDLEHFALRLLIKKEDGQYQYTALANHLSQQYQEILVDEYQDSNMVQETLIQSLSGERFDRPNVFMVGDVKQSIYKFRLAKPELFMEKYERYDPEEGVSHRKIELHQNFRSRAVVLNSVNDIFFRVMTKGLGNIEYDENAALYCGAVFDPCEGRSDELTELLLIDAGPSETGREEESDYTVKETEAKAIAGQIKQLTDPRNGLWIRDKETGEYRICRPGDIVILLRSMSGYSDIFLQRLNLEGVSAYADSSSGYFNTIEIETMLSFLAVVDNPIQDIPLTAVLRSPIVGLSDYQLAQIAAVYKQAAEPQGNGIYGAVHYYVTGPDGESDLAASLRAFLLLLEQMKYQASYLNTHQLIYEVYETTGYYDYACAMPGGEGRKANLDMLVEKAAAFEKTSYKGLFHFIRYIEKLKKYDTDFGEALVLSDEGQAVRIMSIHRSKGLEFPVVFLAGMAKAFNKQDTRSKILIDADLGIATDFFDSDLRIKASTLKKEVLKRKLELDNLGEELRVLYVALTRAKEKLILTACDKNLGKRMEKWSYVPTADGKILPSVTASSGCYLDWILMSIAAGVSSIRVSQMNAGQILEQEQMDQADKELTKEHFFLMYQQQEGDQKYQRYLEKQLSYQYPYLQDSRLFTKVSVSEIKKLSQQPEQEAYNLYEQIRENKTGSQYSGRQAAVRGTVYHRILEQLSFQTVDQRQDLEKQLKTLVEQKRVNQTDLAMIDSEKLWRLIDSPLGRRLSSAQRAQKLYREQQFVTGFPADRLGIGTSPETVIVQGMIDAYFEESDGLVLIDYKTDRIGVGQEALLTKRYQVQMDYYKETLEQLTGKKVKQSIIYSLSLDKGIELGIGREG